MRQTDCPQSGTGTSMFGGRTSPGECTAGQGVSVTADIQALTANQIQQDSQQDAPRRMQSLKEF